MVAHAIQTSSGCVAFDCLVCASFCTHVGESHTHRLMGLAFTLSESEVSQHQQKLQAADPSYVQVPMKHNATPGEQSEAPRRRWKPGQEQHLWATGLNLHVDTRSTLVPILNKLQDSAPNPCASSQSLFRDCSAWPKVLYAPSRGSRLCHMPKYSVFGRQQPLDDLSSFFL